jgi:hypothetical protein
MLLRGQHSIGWQCLLLRHRGSVGDEDYAQALPDTAEI